MTTEMLQPLLYWSGVVFFLLLEWRLSYRPPSVSKVQRWLANLPLSMVNGVVYHAFFFTAITGMLAQVAAQDLGVLNTVSLPHWLRLALGVMIMDFTIYLWHLLNHEVPLLWRFHRVHHSDLNMDVTTANRFHLGEILFSGLVRLAVIYCFGIPAAAYFLFEILVNMAIQFHHSSIKVNAAFEKWWMLLFVPPSMHRVHHSVRISERNSNYGVLFSVWDRLLGTMNTEAVQEDIVIGLGSHRDFSQVGFRHIWLMPFTRKSR